MSDSVVATKSEREAFPTGQVAAGTNIPRVLTFTRLFPNALDPLNGVFVQERIKALARFCPVQVIAPVPWTPPLRWLGERYYRYSQVPHEERCEGLVVHHPRFIVMPKVMKASDGMLLAVSMLGAMRNVRRAYPFDLIDAHWAYPDGVAAAFLAWHFNVPFSITVRGDDINIFPQQFWLRQLIRWTLQKANLVIAVSQDLKRGVEELQVDPSKVVVIPNGIAPIDFHPVDRIDARQALGLRLDERIVLSVGRLHHSKGFPVLVGAVAALARTVPNIRVVIVGGPDHEADATFDIRAAAARHGITEKLTLAGTQPRARLPLWYGAADVFCLPTQREGSANVILEALACGVPCVATPVGCNAEILSSPEVGVLSPANIESMSHALAHALSKEWDRKAIAQHSQKRTWATVASECHHHLTRIVTPAGRTV